MAAPNIVNVSTITGITTVVAGITTDVLADRNGISTIVSNASGSNKVLKINTLVATAIGATTGVDVFIYDTASAHVTAGSTVSIAQTMTVPIFSSLAVIDKNNSIYLQEDSQIGARAQSNSGIIDIVCSYEDIS